MEILEERFGKSLNSEDFIVVGDLNDGNTSEDLKMLVKNKKLENVIERLKEDEQWTHYYKKNKSAEQLDYIILSPTLIEKNKTTLPEIERRGLGNDIDIYDGDRFNKKIEGKDGASDHCAVFMTLNL